MIINQMTIENAKYILLDSTKADSGNSMIRATIDGEELIIPLSEDNAHYAEIMRQVKEDGLTIADADVTEEKTE